MAGSEATLVDFYHGPWTTGAELILFRRPGGHLSTGSIRSGAVVDAIVGETMVRNPTALVSRIDSQVVVKTTALGTLVATMHKKDPFWLLGIGGEGSFLVWWHCQVVGWDSTIPGNDDLLPSTLGDNTEEWVKVREHKTGVTGWFKLDDAPRQLAPARPTQKMTGE